MQVTDVKIRRLQDDTKTLKAYASIVIDDSLAIHDIKIIEGGNGYFIKMPSKKDKNGEFKDIVHPINNELRNTMSNAILDQFNKTL